MIKLEKVKVTKRKGKRKKKEKESKSNERSANLNVWDLFSRCNYHNWAIPIEVLFPWKYNGEGRIIPFLFPFDMWIQCSRKLENLFFV